MNVLLITMGVPGSRQATPDLGLGYIATQLRRHGHTVAFLDFALRPHSAALFSEYLAKHRFGLVGIKLFSSNLHFPRTLVASIRQALPEAVIILGGPHPSCAPEHTLEFFPEADYACQGEGEQCMALLADGLEAGDLDRAVIPGLVYRDAEGAGAIKMNPRGCIWELDDLGLPAWDLMPPRDYAGRQSLHMFSGGKVVAQMSASRGCPYACTFCTAHTITGRRTRYRSPQSVLDEIELLIRDYGVQEIQIADDYFTANREFVFEFCEGVHKRGLDFAWSCPFGIRIDSVTPELVRTMEDAGCYLVSLGIESVNQRILDLMNKRLDVDTVPEKIGILKEHTNMVLQGFFMIGFPTETKEEVMNTIRFACSLPLDFAAFTPLRLTPGAEILDTVREEGWQGFRWDAINIDATSYHPKGISLRKLRAYRRYAFARFYLHPRRLLFLLRQCASLEDAITLLRLGKRRLFPVQPAPLAYQAEPDADPPKSDSCPS